MMSESDFGLGLSDVAHTSPCGSWGQPRPLLITLCSQAGASCWLLANSGRGERARGQSRDELLGRMCWERLDVGLGNGHVDGGEATCAFDVAGPK